MHIALKEAGVPNEYIYAKVRHLQVEKGNVSIVEEDHAFVVVNYQGKRFIVDSYFPEFHGRDFTELTNKNFITPASSEAPWAHNLWKNFPKDEKFPIGITKINSFPNVLTPINKD